MPVLGEEEAARRLREYDILPTQQRLQIAQLLLVRDQHLSADQVLELVNETGNRVSKATVYNTLNLLAEKGLLVPRTLREGRTVFDPNLERHHHLIDTGTGEIHDVPWDAIEVSNVAGLEGLDVREYQVVMRGRKSR